MVTAHFQNLTWHKWWHITGWMVGIVRVYECNANYPDNVYKFFTIAVIDRNFVTIYGMIASNITVKDLRAIDRCLYKFNVRKARWTHNKKETTYNLRG